MHSWLLLAVFALGYASYVPEVPLFVWSGENYVVSRNEQIRGYYTTEAVEHLIKEFWKPSKEHEHEHGLQRFVNLKANEHQLELVVLFLDSALSSEELTKFHSSLPTVTDTMQSTSSFYVPYVTASDSQVLEATKKAARHASRAHANTYVLSTEEFANNFVGSVTRITSLDQITPSFTNSKTDFLIVHVDSGCASERLSTIDKHVEELEKIFKNAKFTNYVSIFTGVESSLEDVLPSNTDMGVPETQKRVILEQQQSSVGNGTYPPAVLNGRNWFNTYFNGTFWELILVLVVVLGLIFFGIRQLLLLQAPDRIPAAANIGNKKKKQ